MRPKSNVPNYEMFHQKNYNKNIENKSNNRKKHDRPDRKGHRQANTETSGGFAVAARERLKFCSDAHVLERFSFFV